MFEPSCRTEHTKRDQANILYSWQLNNKLHYTIRLYWITLCVFYCVCHCKKSYSIPHCPSELQGHHTSQNKGRPDCNGMQGQQKRSAFVNKHKKETSKVNMRQAWSSPLFRVSTFPWDTSTNKPKWLIFTATLNRTSFNQCRTGWVPYLYTRIVWYFEYTPQKQI